MFEDEIPILYSPKKVFTMEKVFMLKGLDCPNCSAKIEKEVGALDGITSSTVNLMKQTLTITVDEHRSLNQSCIHMNPM